MSTQTGPSRASREDFRATSDPALQEGDRSDVKLLDYTPALRASGSASSGRPRSSTSPGTGSTGTSGSPRRSASSACTGSRAFFIGEQKVADELGPIMRAAPTEEQRIFLSTQIADEARHVRFFDRFYSEVGRARGRRRPRRSGSTRLDEHLNEAFRTLFDELLKSRVDRLARSPRTASPGRGGDALPHGHRGDAGAHRPALHHRLQRARGDAARASSRASRTSPATSIATSPSASASSPTAQEDDRYREAIQRMLERGAAGRRRGDRPAVGRGGRLRAVRSSREETHAFAAQCLTRRLKVIGLVPAAA